MATCNMNILLNTLKKLRIDHTIMRSFQKPRFRPPYWYIPKERAQTEEFLTQDNKHFLDEVVQDRKLNQALVQSPLASVETNQTAQWNPHTRRVGLIARKIGNYPLWTKDGKKVQTTLLQVVDNHVVKYVPPEEFNPMKKSSEIVTSNIKRKLGCILVGSETVDPSTVTKDYCGIFNNVGILPKKHLFRFMVSPESYLPPGTPLSATHFRVGDHIDIRAKTMDRGFQGVMKRWGFKGMPASHGVTKTHRRPGNIGAGGQKARVWPGTKMPGHMGNRWRILRGVKILRINTKHNVIWTLGVAIPGETGAMCYLFDTILPEKKHNTQPPFPTQPLAEDVPLEYFDDSVHAFDQQSISFEES
ncbi:unnamed protein product [Chrysodeixis includens]|uniref:Large ribosomal subunit protein uL3m n=1 Tax=Chrysodeixis includens TaxID=689277 RepID=A0A9N8KY97_CHRIL|nr:unnamed protein product [Chrysodeixis includens]